MTKRTLLALAKRRHGLPLALAMISLVAATHASSAQTAGPVHAPAASASVGFLNTPLDVTIWLPAAPAVGSYRDNEDTMLFLETRGQVDLPRGAEAAADDVYAPAQVAPRFAAALGVTLTQADTPQTLELIARTVTDAEHLVAPVKQSPPPAGTGRVRPFVAHPAEKHCPLTPEDVSHHLPDTGSYPSTHAVLGWIWASILSDLVPDRSDALIARGIAFGESRAICGFHYESDVAAGRLAAAALMAREEADPGFRLALDNARREFRAFIARHPAPAPSAQRSR